jgi:hypothetical protein
MRRIVGVGVLSVALVVLTGAGASAKPKPLKSCIAALDAAEGVGVKSELYQENARRCLTGINTAEIVAAKPSGPYSPTPADFTITIVVVEQSCFGSAGCNVQYTIDVGYVGSQLPDANTTYRVVYEVQGGEDPKIGSFTVRGSQVSVPSRDFISTPPNPTLTAVPTNVVKG